MAPAEQLASLPMLPLSTVCLRDIFCCMCFSSASPPPPEGSCSHLLPPLLQARAAGGDKAKDRPYIIYDAVNNALWLRWPKDSGGRRRLLLAA